MPSAIMADAFGVSFSTDNEYYEVDGVYREVAPNERLVFSWAWHSTPESESLVTVSPAIAQNRVARRMDRRAQSPSRPRKGIHKGPRPAERRAPRRRGETDPSGTATTTAERGGSEKPPKF